MASEDGTDLLEIHANKSQMWIYQTGSFYLFFIPSPFWVLIAPLPRARHLGVRIVGLSAMTLKMEVPCLSKCGMS
jgi:hypothetical protein